MNNTISTYAVKFFKLILYAAYIFSCIVFCISSWVSQKLDVTIDQIYLAATENIKGFNLSQIAFDPLTYKIVILLVALILVIPFHQFIIHKVNYAFVGKPVKHRLFNTITYVLIAIVAWDLLFLADSKYKIRDFYLSQIQKTQLYDEYCINTTVDLIDADNKTKNLIYIYLESMETTSYLSKFQQTFSTQELLPNLRTLALDNISFSDNREIGGIHSTYRTDYTKGALFGSTTGISCYNLFDERNAEIRGIYKPGVISLGDILEQYGYNQEFICGSDADFAGRRTYYKQHGNYEVFDYFTAKDKGYIDKDYYVWWGLEDQILYEIAKDEITRLANEDKPFNVSLLTVDTHYPHGYKCKLCDDKYEEEYFNVYACADKQVGQFVEWCSKQEWYDDTVIVIMGDHPTMDDTIYSSVPKEDRLIYDCIINSTIEPMQDTKARIATTLDMFPTTLAAMGFKIEGNRLGLGVNLFSDLPTISEEKSYEWFNKELRKRSIYYEKNYR